MKTFQVPIGGKILERSFRQNDPIPVGGEDFDYGRQPNPRLSQDHLNPMEDRSHRQGGVDSKLGLRELGGIRGDTYLEPAEQKGRDVVMERSYGHTHVYHDHVHNHTNEHDHEHKVKFLQDQT